MSRLGLTGLPPHRPIETALTWLPGVTRARAKAILQEARIDPELHTDALTSAQLDVVRHLLRDLPPGGQDAATADGDNASSGAPWLTGAAVDFAPYLDRVRAYLQRYLAVLRPWERPGEDPTRAPWPTGVTATLDATALRCLRGEALDAERMAFVQRLEPQTTAPFDTLVPTSDPARRFEDLRVAFALEDVAADALWLLLAPALVPEFLWLYRALWRDPAQVTWPEDLLLHALDPFATRGAAVLAALAPQATLRRYGLVRAEGHRWHVPRWVTRHLLGVPADLDDTPGMLVHTLDPQLVAEGSARAGDGVREALTRGFRGRRRFLITGTETGAAVRLAREALATLGEGMLEVRLDLLLDERMNRLGEVLGRARLARSGVFLTHAEAMDAGDHGAERLAALLNLLSRETTTLFFHGKVGRSAETQHLTPRVRLALLRELGCVELGTTPLAPSERQVLWRERLQARMADLELEDTVASVAVYKFGQDEMDLASSLAQASAVARPGAQSRLTMGDVEKACREVASARLAGLATRINVRGRWNTTVLPEDTREILEEMVRFGRHAGHVLDVQGYGRTMGYGRALTALFSGPSGTGKTLCAGLVARDLGLELFRVDLASVVSKYIGETEERLSKLFDASQDAGIALLFDEADALFAKRTDVQSSVDRYANLEVNYLLQRLEDFDGVVILTSNHPDAIDTAFLRRIRFKPHFPPPEAAERARLWQVMVPPDAPQEPDLKPADLAADWELTGGQIQNAVLRAAVWAQERSVPLSHALLAKAGEREYKDAGRVVREYADD